MRPALVTPALEGHAIQGRAADYTPAQAAVLTLVPVVALTPARAAVLTLAPVAALTPVQAAALTLAQGVVLTLAQGVGHPPLRVAELTLVRAGLAPPLRGAWRMTDGTAPLHTAISHRDDDARFAGHVEGLRV